VTALDSLLHLLGDPRGARAGYPRLL
jgi:hypothetical protein